MKNTIAITFTVLAISACAHRPPLPSIDEVFFETKINQDGTKLFAFSIPLRNKMNDQAGNTSGNAAPPSREPPRSGRSLGSSGRKSGAASASNEQLYTMLDEQLLSAHYCREGYMEIDTHQTEDRLHLLGECNDTATDEDRINFPNPVY